MPPPQRAFDETVNFTRNRKAFGQTIFDFQNTQFRLAEMKAELAVGRASPRRSDP